MGKLIEYDDKIQKFYLQPDYRKMEYHDCLLLKMLQIYLKIFTPIYKSGRSFFSVLAKRSMFKCLTPLALKSDSHLPKKFLFICFNESPLEMMKNAFYLNFKALFVLKIFKFLS